MSGGHFGYMQYRMEDIAVEIDSLISYNERDPDYRYPPKIIERFKEAAHTIRQAQEMTQRVDWLVSGDDGDDGDDGEETFLNRWNSEVRQYFFIPGDMI